MVIFDMFMFEYVCGMFKNVILMHEFLWILFFFLPLISVSVFLFFFIIFYNVNRNKKNFTIVIQIVADKRTSSRFWWNVNWMNHNNYITIRSVLRNTCFRNNYYLIRDWFFIIVCFRLPNKVIFVFFVSRLLTHLKNKKTFLSNFKKQLNHFIYIFLSFPFFLLSFALFLYYVE